MTPEQYEKLKHLDGVELVVNDTPDWRVKLAFRPAGADFYHNNHGLSNPKWTGPYTLNPAKAIENIASGWWKLAHDPRLNVPEGL